MLTKLIKWYVDWKHPPKTMQQLREEVEAQQEQIAEDVVLRKYNIELKRK